MVEPLYSISGKRTVHPPGKAGAICPVSCGFLLIVLLETPANAKTRLESKCPDTCGLAGSEPVPRYAEKRSASSHTDKQLTAGSDG